MMSGETIHMLQNGEIVIGWHVPGDRQKITKSLGMANAWAEAGHDIQPLIEQSVSVRPYIGPPRTYCGSCGHVAPKHWDRCPEADDEPAAKDEVRG